MKILVSLTSYLPIEQRYFRQVIQSYKEYPCTVDFVLSINYDSELSKEGVCLPKQYNGREYAWNNKQYIAENYQQYDHIIDSDSDIVIPYTTFLDYVGRHTLVGNENIIGFLSSEGNTLLTLKNCPLYESRDNTYFTPKQVSSACFVVDRERYTDALSRGMPITPYSLPEYNAGDTSRTDIYRYYQKKVSIDGLLTGDSIVRHLPIKYSIILRGQLMTPQQCYALLKL
jgi:hypothetical protein